MIFSSLAALAANPACYYRFESLTDATIDSLVLPAAAAAAAGAPPTVELFCRPQGSVYVYAKNATTGDFGLTQIDEWHGAGHPLAW